MHGGRVNSGCGHIDILGESLVSTCLVAAPPRCATRFSPFIARNSQTLANFQSRITVLVETFNTSAVSSQAAKEPQFHHLTLPGGR